MARSFGGYAGGTGAGDAPMSFRLRGLATGFGALAILNKAVDDFTSKLEASAKRIIAADQQLIQQPTSVRDITAGLQNLGQTPSLNPFANANNPTWQQTLGDWNYWRGGGPARAIVRNLAAPFLGKGPSDNPFETTANANVAAAIAKAAPEDLYAYMTQGGAYAARARTELDRRLGAAQFGRQATAAFAQSTYGSVTNVTVNAPAGDRNAIGLSIKSALDARDRNNGRLQTTTFTRG
jgi:hypothetical protein